MFSARCIAIGGESISSSNASWVSERRARELLQKRAVEFVFEKRPITFGQGRSAQQMLKVAER
jgi:hypothetical protein